MLPETAVGRAAKGTDMDITKKAVVEPPKSTAPPVKVQSLPEHRAQQEAAKPGWSQPKPKAKVGPNR
jgi:hypothetical protein